MGGRFWQGVLAGVCGVVFLLSALGYHSLRGRGISIFIDQERMAEAIRARVCARAAQELPGMLNQIAADVASRLMAGEAGPSLVLEMGEKRVALPSETAAWLWNEFGGAARDSIAATLKEFDLQPYADQLAGEAYQIVLDTLAQDIYGKTFRFQANRWLSVPVTVEGGPDESGEPEGVWRPREPQ